MKADNSVRVKIMKIKNS